jgi:hypothetical protein
MSKRDDFPQRVKNAIAAHAHWLCSFPACQKPTVGKSEESPTAIIKIGKAAHICGASAGPGSRRYDSLMTPEQRKSIDNAIWLCADHADQIDDDEVTYTVEALRAMKREHEAACSRNLRLGKSHDLGAGLLAIGPEIVCTGDIRNVSANSWTLHLKHFVVGDVHDLVTFIDEFAMAAGEAKYILSGELGDGRTLLNAPSLTKQSDGYSLLCPVAPSYPRIDAQQLGSDWALHPETQDLYLDASKNIARVSGLDALPQRIQSVLSLQRGESPFDPGFGIRFFEYFETHRGSPWLGLLLKLDVIRQAAIPYMDVLKRQYTPLQCVTRVNNIELLSEALTNNRLPVRVDFIVQGIGRWQRDLSVYMPTKEQMASQAAQRARIAPLLR